MLTFENVNYYLFEDSYYIVGDNKSSSATALSTSFSGEIEIPEKIEGKSILEIGYRAFDGCTSLTGITIKAKLRSINELAFYRCTGIKYLNIPSTVTFFGYASLYFGTGSSGVSLPITIEFDPGGKTSFYAPHYSFSGRYTISIIYPCDIAPTYGSNMFDHGVTSAYIYAPSVFQFCTKQTTIDQSQCPTPLFKAPKPSKNRLKVSCYCRCNRNNYIVTLLFSNSIIQ